ncbi:MAG TPA: C4-type zinc ribbon domain-containing protein [Thermoleophilia bacterium]|nr:C4-type zinc ribbon domain-containing protein [Thermoleophilia bacterium]
MQETIRKLLQLQEHDLQILDLKRREKELREHLAAEQREVDQQIKALEAEQNRLRHLQAELKHLEVELESRQQKRQQLEAQQAAVKRNVEYKAMMKEILDVQAAIRLTEDKILEKYEEIEQERQQTTIRDKEVAERRAKLQERVVAAEAELHEIERRLGEARNLRKQAGQLVEPRALRLFERIFKNKQGAVVVPIGHRTCSGCHLAVTPQVENLARRNEAIVQCENCARILYVPSDEEAVHQDATVVHEEAAMAHGDVEPAHGDVEPAHGDVESAHGDVESAHGDVEPAHGDVESDREDTQPDRGAAATDEAAS